MKSDESNRSEVNIFGAREILLRITAACNQKCVFCNTDGLSFSMNTRAVHRECYGAARHGTVPIFTGGEPTLHKDLLTMARVLSEMGFRNISLQTNAVRAADEKFAAALKRAGFERAIVSLHSHDAGVSGTITGSPGDFHATLAGIRNLMANGINVVINHVLNTINYRDSEHFVDFLEETILVPCAGLPGSMEALSLSFVQPAGKAFANRDLVPRLSGVAPFFTAALRKCRGIGLPAVNPGCGVPVCFTPGFETSSSEYHLLSEGVSGVRTVDVNRYAKSKGPQCARCVHNAFCLGVWSNYASIYGLDELHPVADAGGRRRKSGRRQ